MSNEPQFIQTDGSVAVIVPVLNEEASLADWPTGLLQTPFNELIVIDGGSTDATVSRLQQCTQDYPALSIIESGKGRAAQMAAGAETARSEWLLFLHADTQLPRNYQSALSECARANRQWGRFDIQFSSLSGWFDVVMKVVAAFINARSRFTHIATGDQAIFVHRNTYHAVGGMPQQALMEDIELSKRLKRAGPGFMARQRVTTSARRWHRDGVVKTILLMWRLRVRYYFGASPDELAQYYRDTR